MSALLAKFMLFFYSQELDNILASRFLHKDILIPANQHINKQSIGISSFSPFILNFKALE
jgi:hypothetical protein